MMFDPFDDNHQRTSLSDQKLSPRQTIGRYRSGGLCPKLGPVGASSARDQSCRTSPSRDVQNGTAIPRRPRRLRCSKSQAIRSMDSVNLRREDHPLFWHPPDQHPYGELQDVARRSSHKCPGSASAFMAAYPHPHPPLLAPRARCKSRCA
jgi:hypothetical protein